jgi:predicted MFS family arabinose efflux permease
MNCVFAFFFNSWACYLFGLSLDSDFPNFFTRRIRMKESNNDSHVSRTMTILGCAAFVSVAAIRICDPMLPEIAESFKISTGEAAGSITSFAVTYGALQMLYGPLGDRYNKYFLIMLATFACIVGSVGAAISPGFGWLVFSRILAGATAAGIIPLSIAWIGDNIPYERRQAALARFISGPILGLIGGQFLGGSVADMFGWRWCFAVLAVMYIFVGILLYWDLRPSMRSFNAPVPGSALSALNPSADGKSFLSQFATVLHVRWARVILVTVFLESVAVWGSLALVPAYLHASYDISLTAAGAIIAMFGLGGLSYTALASRLIVWLKEKGLAMAAGLILCAAFLIFSFGKAWVWAIPASYLAGVGFYMLHNTLQTNATQMAPLSRGTAVAMFVAAFFIGQSAGVSAGAVVIDVAGFSWLFLASSAALLIIGSGFAFALHRLKAAYSELSDSKSAI